MARQKRLRSNDGAVEAQPPKRARTGEDCAEGEGHRVLRMTLRQLRIELMSAGLSLSGSTKEELQQRLLDHVSKPPQSADQGTGGSLLRRLSASVSAASSTLSGVLFGSSEYEEDKGEDSSSSASSAPSDTSDADTDSSSDSDVEQSADGRTDASCYITEISILPGGMRRGEIFLSTTVDDALEPFRWEFDARPMGFAALCQVFCEGETCVYVVDEGIVTAKIDVRAFVYVSIPRLDIHDERLSEVWALQQRSRGEHDTEENNIFCRQEAEDLSIELSEGCVDQTDIVKFRVDWPELHAAFEDHQLTKNLLQPGETFTLASDDSDSYLSCVSNSGGQLGFNDYECIERLCHAENMQLTTFTKSAAT